MSCPAPSIATSSFGSCAALKSSSTSAYPLVVRTVNEQERSRSQHGWSEARVVEEPTGDADDRADARVGEAGVQADGECRRRSERVAADADALGIAEAERQELVEDEGDVGRLVDDVLPEVRRRVLVARVWEGRRRDDVAGAGPAGE
jgi:hypothetical protein